MTRYFSSSGLIFFLVCLAVLAPLAGQSQKDNRTLLAENKEKLEKLQARLKEETDYFDAFVKDRRTLLEQKQKEKDGVQAEVQRLELKTEQDRARTRELQSGIDQLTSVEKATALKMVSAAEALRNRVHTGIPFERDRRESLLVGLAGDLKAGNASPVEGLTRFAAFFDAEDILGYDGQVSPVVADIKGERLNSTLLRLGRVLFAVDTGEEVYWWQPGPEGWFLDDKNPAALADRRAVRAAVQVLQGKLAPQLVPLPVPLSRVQRSQTNAGGVK